MKTISALFLFFLLTFMALRSWMDYAWTVAIPGKVESVQSRWDGKKREREYDFGICRYTVVEHDPVLARFWGFFGAGAPELDGVVEGDRVSLWAMMISGRATPVRRRPIVTAIVPLLLLLLLLVDRREPSPEPPPRTVTRVRPDGSTEVRQDRHRCLGCIFLDTFLAVLAFGALLLIGYGMFAPFLDGESSLREGLSFISIFVLATPLFALVRRLDPVPSVRWNDSTVWIHGVKFQRSDLRAVVMRNGSLEIHRAGSRRKPYFRQEASWTAAQLEKVGVALERVPET
jgi:hypothetical protein